MTVPLLIAGVLMLSMMGVPKENEMGKRRYCAKLGRTYSPRICTSVYLNNNSLERALCAGSAE